MMRVFALLVLVSLFCLAQGFHTFLKSPKLHQQAKKRGNSPPACPLPVHNPALDSTNLPLIVTETLNLVNKTVQSILKENNCTAAAYVTILSGGETIFSQGYNYISSSDLTPPTDQTLFRIGSVSKVFATLELLHQYEKGNVLMDVDVSQYAPEFVVAKPANEPNAKVTFNSIASQISGLARECPCFFYGCNLNNTQIFDRYHGTPLLWLPERLPSYSNFGFALIGNILGGMYPLNETDNLFPNCKEHGGTETCQFLNGVHQDILIPLGMDSTGFFYNVDVAGEVAQGYNGNNPLPDKVAWGSLGWLSPAGAMFSSHSDLAKLMSYILTHLGHEAPDSAPLSSSALREWMSPHFINKDGVTGFGRPWEMFYVETESLPGIGFWANTKDGDVTGYSANLALVQDLNLGIMVTVAAEPPVNISPEIASFITAKMVDTLANYYYSQQQLPLLPTNYTDYTGKYVIDPVKVSTEQLFMFQLLFGEKITHEHLPSLKISYENGHSLHFDFEAGDDTLEMSIMRSNVIVGDEDYWQLLVPSTTFESNFFPFYISDCPTMEAGYEGVHIVFEIKQNEVVSVGIPTEFYGVSFRKIKI